MIIEANTEDGQNTKVYDQDGKQLELPIKSYNTETQEAVLYELDEKGKVKMTEWSQDGKKMTRQPMIKLVKLEGSYAEINGKRV